jgi:hypothetical protein
VTSRSTARYTLAAIRLFNGGVALFAPETLARRLGADPQANGAVIYVLRMFGIRTVVIGTELVVLRGEALDRSLRKGILIHATDTVAAAAAGAKGYLPPRTATLTTLISTVNTGLAIAARDRRHRRLLGHACRRLPPVAALAAVRRRGRADRPQGRLGQAADPARPGRAGRAA